MKESLFWRVLSEVRAEERGRFLFFLALSGLLGLALTAGLIAAEALFLSRVGIGFLPHVLLLSAVTTVAGSLIYAYWVGRSRNDTFFAVLLLIGATLLGLGTLGTILHWPWAPAGLFVVYFLGQAVFLNHYWTFTWDYFDTLATKRLFPLLTAGHSLGGFGGGLIAAGMMQLATPAVLLVFSATALAATALLLRLGRRKLRRWGPLELEEADETSVAGIRRAWRYIEGSSLGRWLVLSTAAMAFALFVAQYVYSDIFVQLYPHERELAAFLGIFLAVTNLAEVVIELAVVPRLIQRMGVAQANLVHPFLTLLSFAALTLNYGMSAAVGARMNRELIENAVAAPIRNLVYNGLPFRYRGRIRALLEGLVGYTGMALAGGVLLLVGGRVSPVWLSLFGGATALLYLFANLRVRGAYLEALIRELRVGRLDLGEVGGELGRWEAARLGRLWEALLSETTDRTVPIELGLAPILAKRGLSDPLLSGMRHSDPRVRRACVEALGGVGGRRVRQALFLALSDSDGGVRHRAIGSLRESSEEGSTPIRRSLRVLLSDPDPKVRAEAAFTLGSEGGPTLRDMVGSLDPGQASAALRRLSAEHADLALARCEDPNPEARAEALECLARLGRPHLVPVEQLTAGLNHPDMRVRRAAIRAFAAHEEPELAQAVARGLADPANEVRDAASTAAGALGNAGAMAAAAYLDAPALTTVDAAVRVLAAVGTSGARQILAGQLRDRVSETWRSLAMLQTLEAQGGSELRLLKLAYRNALSVSFRVAFMILERSEDARLVQTLVKVLRFGPTRTRGDALEVLSNLGDREVARLLVLLLESGSIEEKLRLLVEEFPPPVGIDGLLEAARINRDPWVRRAYAAFTARDPRNGDEAMERLLYLRRVPLFSLLTLDQLEAINLILSESTYVRDEVICREGEVGSDLYVLVDGEVDVFRRYGAEDPLHLATLTPVSCFGEMAVLSDEPRSATVVTTQESVLLTLEGSRLKELIHQMPEIAFDFFGVLTSRLREADDRYEALSREARATS